MAKFFVVLTVSLMLHVDLVAAVEIKKKPIKIVTNNWTSQIVLSKVVGEVFSALGYQVQYLKTSVSDQWGALAHGVAHLQVEVWEGTMADMFNRMVAEGSVLDAGEHEAKTREDWWYPAYAEKVCPGLPDWQALKACANQFAIEGDNFGTYFAGPWEKPDEARIRALGLNFRVRNLKNGDDLWVELKKAYAEQRPIVLFNWTPNWVESRYAGKFVEFPAYDPVCESDPAWGVNGQYLYDCGNPKNGWLKKAAWHGMPDTWDCAYRTLKKINFSNQQIASAAALVDVDLLSYDAAAKQWLQENKVTWQGWIPGDCVN
ncbi:glycine betaine ABC transporter substrate-binding protein [Oleiphilus messinensis]|uniref:Glycine betaine ABC transporter substrate-binding protein n=1 Tax=Oleiphilus messinensis TaxID=141451 RepID=A0A1Y0I2H4_9GAMM|nr:ABC transporter substrate-binding protein [Oleiphilus messinensis]ARU54601.1 glycine betaine ABC transporter substrate-binding protein [Oleiphilus messinensis]